jgi:hypothetical protein
MQKLGMTKSELALYRVYEEVPFNTIGTGFMKADIVLIKRNALNQIDDVIVIENKLSKGTDYTVRQKEGFGLVGTGPIGGKDMTLTYAVGDLAQNSILNIKKAKCLKISDHGSDNIGSVLAGDIDFVNFSRL